MMRPLVLIALAACAGNPPASTTSATPVVSSSASASASASSSAPSNVVPSASTAASPSAKPPRDDEPTESVLTTGEKPVPIGGESEKPRGRAIFLSHLKVTAKSGGDVKKAQDRFEPTAAAKACRWAEGDALKELEQAGKPHRDVQVKLIVEIGTDGTVRVDDDGSKTPPETTKCIVDGYRKMRASGVPAGRYSLVVDVGPQDS